MQLLLSDAPVLGLPDVTTDNVCPGCYKVNNLYSRESQHHVFAIAISSSCPDSDLFHRDWCHIAIHSIAIVFRFSIPGQVSAVLGAWCPGAVRSVWRAGGRADSITWSADTFRRRRGASGWSSAASGSGRWSLSSGCLKQVRTIYRKTTPSSIRTTRDTTWGTQNLTKNAVFYQDQVPMCHKPRNNLQGFKHFLYVTLMPAFQSFTSLLG